MPSDDCLHDGSLPLIGVNTFLPKDHGGDIVTDIELIRSTEGEKGQQIENVQHFQQLSNNLEPVRPERSAEGAKSKGLGLPTSHRPRTPKRVRQPNGGGQDAFAGADQPCVALHDVGGEYRRNM